MATYQMVPPSPYGQWPSPTGPAPSTATAFQPAPYPYPYPYPFPHARWPYRPMTLGRGVGIAGGIMLLMGGSLIVMMGIVYLLWWWEAGLVGMLDVAAFAVCIVGEVATFKRWYRLLALFAPCFLAFAAVMSMGIDEETGWLVLPFASISLALMLMGFQEMRSDRPWQMASVTSPAGPPGDVGAASFYAQGEQSPYGQWPYPMAAYPPSPSPYGQPPYRRSSLRRMLGIAGVVLLLVAGGFVMFFGVISVVIWFNDWTVTMLFAVLYFAAVTAAIVSSVAVLTRTHRGLSLLGPVLVVVASVATMFEFDIFTIFIVPIAVLALVFIFVGMPETRPDRPVGWTVQEPPAEPSPSGGVPADATRPAPDVATTDWPSR
jgi:hypothetical protein